MKMPAMSGSGHAPEIEKRRRETKRKWRCAGLKDVSGLVERRRCCLCLQVVTAAGTNAGEEEMSDGDHARGAGRGVEKWRGGGNHYI